MTMKYLMIFCCCCLLGCATNSLSTPNYSDFVDKQEQALKKLKIGVIENIYKSEKDSLAEWHKSFGWEIRPDENVHLYEFLKNSKLFQKVYYKSVFQVGEVDYIFSCNVDCIHTTKLNRGIFMTNLATLGIGFLLGLPHENTSAFYVLESTVQDGKKENFPIISGSLVENYRDWYFNNIYYEPTFYDANSLQPLFKQVLFDFLRASHEL